MPNWCFTDITIRHNDEKKLKEFENKINKFTSHNYKENGFGLNWLGNIVGNSGIGTIDEDGKTNVSCRGSLLEMNNYGNILQIQTDTAWVPMLEMWVLLLDKYLPDADLTYIAEEGGCDIWCTNDEDYIGKYYLDVWENIEGMDIESMYCAEEDDVVDILQELLHTSETNIDKLQEQLWDSNYSDILAIHKWKYEDIGAWD